jgi:hypothetical protein
MPSNNAPTLANPIADQATDDDAPLSFTVPANTFADTDAGDTLMLTATRADGSALPSWLTYNSVTLAFSGVPANGDVGTFTIKLVATDSGTIRWRTAAATICSTAGRAPTR